MNQKISKIAKELLQDDYRFCHLDSVGYGDLDLLHEIFDRSGIILKNNHPINKCNAVLNAIDRESKFAEAIFQKEFFRSYRGLARVFCFRDPCAEIP